MLADSGKTTTIQRVWTTTFIRVIPGILLCLVALYLGYVSLPSIDWSNGITFGGVLVIILLAVLFVGVSLIWNGYKKAGMAACPVCGQPLKNLSFGKNEGVWCAAGKHYVNGENGTLWETAPDMVADSPAFTTQLPANKVQIPAECCVCGARATQTEKLQLTETTGNGCLLVLALVLSFSGNAEDKVLQIVNIPHCDAHQKGALLSGTKDSAKIRFRSYPYQRAFCELNHTHPE